MKPPIFYSFAGILSKAFLDVVPAHEKSTKCLVNLSKPNKRGNLVFQVIFAFYTYPESLGKPG